MSEEDEDITEWQLLFSELVRRMGAIVALKLDRTSCTLYKTQVVHPNILGFLCINQKVETSSRMSDTFFKLCHFARCPSTRNEVWQVIAHWTHNQEIMLWFIDGIFYWRSTENSTAHYIQLHVHRSIVKHYSYLQREILKC